MDFTLIRDQLGEKSTPGKFFLPDGSFLVHSLERPWLNNQRKVSCIPPGRYQLKKRYSQKFGWHLWLQDVPGRSLILIHTANYVRQLQGCIAPGLRKGEPLKGDSGIVWDSAKAVKRLPTWLSLCLIRAKKSGLPFKTHPNTGKQSKGIKPPSWHP